MSDNTPHQRHDEDAKPDDAAPTPAASDEVEAAAASAQSLDDAGDGADDGADDEDEV